MVKSNNSINTNTGFLEMKSTQYVYFVDPHNRISSAQVKPNKLGFSFSHTQTVPSSNIEKCGMLAVSHTRSLRFVQKSDIQKNEQREPEKKYIRQKKCGKVPLQLYRMLKIFTQFFLPFF